RTPRWFGDGCGRRDLLAHELSSTGLGASVPHAVLGRQFARAAPAPRWVPEGSSRPMDDPLGRPRALGSSFFVLALVVFLVAVPSPSCLPRGCSVPRAPWFSTIGDVLSGQLAS